MRTRRSGVFVAALAATATPAVAQQDASPVKLERVEITGSNIRRVDTETGLPVQIITREEIDRGGILDAKDLLDRISAVQSFGNFTEGKGVGNDVQGLTAASLRGLGADRTLILLNGRRISAYALNGGSGVDISGLPASAIERVEVLKDGASAIYGTDAIGGVINFILRKDFQGIEAGATYLGTEHGGGNNWRASLTAGAGSIAKDGFNAFIHVDHVRQYSLRAADRDFSKTSYLPDFGVDRTSTNSFPANIQQPGGFGSRGSTTFNPTIPLKGATADSCLPPYSFPTLRLPLRCAFDYAAVIDDIPQSDKTSVVGRMTWQFNPDHQFFVEGSYYHGEYLYKISPTPVASNFTNTPMTLPPSSPYYPAAYVASLPNGNANLPLSLLYRTVELGARNDRPDVDEWRAVVGLKGTLRDWDYQLTAGYTSNKEVVNYVSGFLDETTFGPLLRSGVVNSFGYNTPDVLAQMRTAQVVGPVSTNMANDYGAEFKASRPLKELPGGPLSMAFGLEARKEGLQQVNAEVLYSGNVIAGSGPTPSFDQRTRNVWSAFAELDIPIFKGFDANLAVRHDHYGDFGGTTNPKMTLRWQARQDFVLRGSVGTGFRAPALFDLFVPNTFVPSGGVDDPLRCPVTQAFEDCQDGISFRVKQGKNPNLKPERSRQLNLGLVAEPTTNLSLTVDYYLVRIDDLITVVPFDAIFNDYARWAPTLVVRKPPDAQYPNLPGPIDYIVQTPVNAGQKRTSGIDLDLRWRLPASAWGRWALSLSGTYLLTYKASEFEQVGPGTADNANGYGALPRWRHYASLDWSRGAWGATLAHTYQNPYTETDLKTCDSSGANCTGRRTVASNSVIDLLARYEGIRKLRIQIGVRNLFDRAPPSAYATGGFQVGYDPTYADPRGRMYFASLRWTLQ